RVRTRGIGRESRPETEGPSTPRQAANTPTTGRHTASWLACSGTPTPPACTYAVSMPCPGWLAATVATTNPDGEKRTLTTETPSPTTEAADIVSGATWRSLVPDANASRKSSPT